MRRRKGDLGSKRNKIIMPTTYETDIHTENRSFLNRVDNIAVNTQV